jgi:hypothetical protein
MTETLTQPVAKKFANCTGCGKRKAADKLKDGKCQTCRILAIQPLPEEPKHEPATVAEALPPGKKKFTIYREEIHVSKVEVVAEDEDEAIDICQDFEPDDAPPKGVEVLWTKPCCLNYGDGITWQVEEGGKVLQESDGLNVKELIADDKEVPNG